MSRPKSEINEFLKYDIEMQSALGVIALKSPKFKFILRVHPAAEAEPQVKKLIGYFPTGEWQILAERGKKKYSIIKGMVSMGQFEVAKIGKSVSVLGRFPTAENVAKYLNYNYNKKIK